MTARFLLAICVFLTANDTLANAVQTAPEKAESAKWVAQLAVIDKLTATTHRLSASIGSTIAHEKIEIHVKRCWIEDALVTPDHAALVEIYQSVGSSPDRLFSGWLFANKSELSHMEHPSYDVQLLACEKVVAEASE